jgi:hypothetical protein
VSNCCLTPNEQYEELDISKNSGKPYKNTNFDKEDIYQTLFLVVFEYFYDVYLFEINSLAIRRTVTYNERTTLGK